jgi:sodium/potassium-transporting ATPase subunit alpha
MQSHELQDLDKEPAPSREAVEIPAHREAMLDLVDIQSKFQKRKASLFAHKHKRPVQDDTIPIIIEEDKPHLTVDNVPVNSKEEPADTVQDAKKDLEVDYHAIPLETLLDRLETDESFGLTSSKASEKLKKDGPNAIKVGNRFAGLFKIIGYLFGGFGIIMWPAAIMAVLSYRPLGDPDPDIANLGLAIVLFSVIFISAFFSGWQDWQSSKVMNTIGKMLPAEAQVTRDGVTSMIPVANLVTGDIIVVQNGTRVPADVRIVNHSQIKVDNSILTGESEPISCTVACTNEENFMETKNLLVRLSSISNNV